MSADMSAEPPRGCSPYAARRQADGAAPALVIERLTVRSGRIACDLVVLPGVSPYTTPRLIRRVLPACPSIARHACVNDEGDTFAAVMNSTSLPHLFEHVVIDLQARAASASGLSSSDAVFVGTTEWTDEAAGKAHVEVSFTDDLVALRAFRDAARILNEAVVS